jgi:sec-independent protein translocase protein TatC
VSQLIVAIPMLLIYEASIFISKIVYKNQQKIDGKTS